MDATDLLPLLEQLDDHIDDLDEALCPVLNSAVAATSKKLPVLDKAKFHVLITYALESLIFSYLRLHGVNAKEHPVFRELTRVKQYFDKIKALETEPEQRTLTLDKQAASRFIKHGLAGNDKIDLERKEQQAKEKARAQLKASLLAKKAATAAVPESASKSPANRSESDSDSESDGGEKPTEKTQPEDSAKKMKKKKVEKSAKRESTKAKKKRSEEGRKDKDKKKERRKKKQETRKARMAQ